MLHVDYNSEAKLLKIWLIYSTIHITVCVIKIIIETNFLHHSLVVLNIFVAKVYSANNYIHVHDCIKCSRYLGPA